MKNIEKCGILAVGTELLMGQTVNTNATYLSQKVNEKGIGMYYHMTTGDNVNRLKETFMDLLNKVDMIITTGGLGPTQDDLTKETIAECMELPLKFDEKQHLYLKEKFGELGIKLEENNLKQCYFPEGSTILYNEAGTAPGCIIEKNNKIIVILPGPPREINYLYDKYLNDYFNTLSNVQMRSLYLSIYGLGESTIENKLMDLIDEQTNPTLATYAGDGKVIVRLTATGNAEDDIQNKLMNLKGIIYQRIGQYIVSEKGESIDEVLVEKLLETHLHISAAESCTGGLFISNLIRHSGVSEIIDRSFITYSNQAKSDLLNVSEETLNDKGAVSEETCNQMLDGLYNQSRADVCVAITGIAGPTGGTEEKPVGLVYIGMKYEGKNYIFKKIFSGDRNRIQNRTVNFAYKKILDMLKGTSEN